MYVLCCVFGDVDVSVLGRELQARLSESRTLLLRTAQVRVAIETGNERHEEQASTAIQSVGDKLGERCWRCLMMLLLLLLLVGGNRIQLSRIWDGMPWRNSGTAKREAE